MRRTFPRIPSSPQATTTVETPAHYALTLICCSLALLSEVVIGNVEPNMSLFRRTLQNYKKNARFSTTMIKKLSENCIF